MIRFAAPGFLLAGALVALVPLALHMLARLPPERRPLPTARFLTADRRTRLRLRRPSDLVLLTLRLALLLLLGAAFAGPEWLPERTGSGTIVLLDGGRAMNGAWAGAMDSARARLDDGGAVVVFDTAARILTDPAALDSLARAGPTDAPSSYLAALRGLRVAAAEMTAESAAAVLVTRPRWGAWSPAVPLVRSRAWPARLEIAEVGTTGQLSGAAASQTSGPTSDPDPAPASPPAPAAVSTPEAVTIVGTTDHPLRPYVVAALKALGFTTADSVGGSGLRVRLTRPTGADVTIHLGRAPSAEPGAPGTILLQDGATLPGWLRLPGLPEDSGRVVAVWEDGRPAAMALERDGACAAHLAASPSGTAAAHPAFPRLLLALADGCGAGHPGTAPDRSGTAQGGLAGAPLNDPPLDRGARGILAGDTLPRAAALADLGAGTGRPLTRLLLALALLVAGIEAFIAYRRSTA